MMRSVFIDTNVMLDLLLLRDPYYHDAQVIFSLVDKGLFEAHVSALSFSNAAYILRKYVGHEKMTKVLKEFSYIVEITPVNESVVRRSLNYDTGFLDIEDAMQYYSARDADCECIITRNEKDFANSILPVFSPSEFISVVKEGFK